MRDEYDFSQSAKNPYAEDLLSQITIGVDGPTIEYFKGLSDKVGIPYLALINLYLRDCASTRRELQIKWQ